jgi:vesicle-fusing ATPase
MIYLFLFTGRTFKVLVSLVQMFDARAKAQISQQIVFEGLLAEQTAIELTAKHNPYFSIPSQQEKFKDILPDEIKFEQMGIGGLDQELENIFRRAFASRRFPTSKLKKYGISHVKGVLMYGPPGTGKTLIARQLAKALKCKEPKIINGPEILSKYVGESEENVRKLFADARKDMQALGDDSPLHIIVFDEIDAICKPRGSVSSGTGVHDSVVNQLLSMIDGVDSLNNVLVIGMTNRKDMIDEAVLRPGRFEVHIEVSLPDEKGRQDILRIHTRTMTENKVLGADVNLPELASMTKNYTGAELESIVKSASSFAFNRVHNILDTVKKNPNEEIIIMRSDFMHAVDEVKPMFGSDSEKFDILLRNKLVNYGPRFERILKVINDSIEQTKSGKSSQLHSLLFEGPVGTGKTAIAAYAAMNCGFPYVKLISPENFVGYTETGKINAIVKIFEDAYRSPFSCIVIDNIERIIEFIDIGPRFSNPILQALLVLVKKVPKKADHRIMILGTTNQAKVLRDLEITQCFNVNLKVPALEDVKEILTVLNGYAIPDKERESIAKYAARTPIKKLLMILDMVSASSSSETIDFESFKECFDAISSDNN